MLRVEEFEQALKRHVLEAWFPRSLDLAHGGFLCDFDRTWTWCGPHEKLLEFQARQTATAAAACLMYPAERQYRDAALHGFRYLRETMWDRDAGGWYHRLDRQGRPLDAATKHAHGTAYAIHACVPVYDATGEPAALDLAREGFEWPERCARDPVHGGYFGFMKRDGTVIRDPSQSPLGSASDHLGTEIGLKDVNVHSDMLETLVHLYRARPDARVGERLAEMVDIVSQRMLVPSTGALHDFVTPDWRPVPHISRAGHEFQAAYRLTLLDGVTGDPSRLHHLAELILRHADRYMLDPRHGGFFFAAPGVLPREVQGRDLRARAKVWWVQAEALRALLAVSRVVPEREMYLERLEVLWRYFQREFLDSEHGGIYHYGLDVVPPWRRRLGARFAPAGVTRKGHAWKDASHDGRALLYCVGVLRLSA